MKTSGLLTLALVGVAVWALLRQRRANDPYPPINGLPDGAVSDWRATHNNYPPQVFYNKTGPEVRAILTAAFGTYFGWRMWRTA